MAPFQRDSVQPIQVGASLSGRLSGIQGTSIYSLVLVVAFSRSQGYYEDATAYPDGFPTPESKLPYTSTLGYI